jgi:hypothetical protein
MALRTCSDRARACRFQGLAAGFWSCSEESRAIAKDEGFVVLHEEMAALWALTGNEPGPWPSAGTLAPQLASVLGKWLTAFVCCAPLLQGCRSSTQFRGSSVHWRSIACLAQA